MVPATPDLIGTLDDTAWMESGTTLVGVDAAITYLNAERAPQQVHTTWNTDTLRLAWTGANWNTNGDLFVYVSTNTNGAMTLYDPYQTDEPAISLPTGFGATHMVWVRDAGTATLMRWNGNAWVIERTLGEPNFRFTLDSSRTDIALPFAWLGLTAASSLKVVAVASEEQRLRLWASFPDKNPLSVLHDDAGAFKLTNAYTFPSLGSGVRPNGGTTPGANGALTLTSDSDGIAVDYLSSGVFDRLKPGMRLDANQDGTPDVAVPVATKVVPVGDGQRITYTLRYANRGTAPSRGVVVKAHQLWSAAFRRRAQQRHILHRRCRRWHHQYAPHRDGR